MISSIQNSQEIFIKLWDRLEFPERKKIEKANLCLFFSGFLSKMKGRQNLPINESIFPSVIRLISFPFEPRNLTISAERFSASEHIFFADFRNGCVCNSSAENLKTSKFSLSNFSNFFSLEPLFDFCRNARSNERMKFFRITTFLYFVDVFATIFVGQSDHCEKNKIKMKKKNSVFKRFFWRTLIG